MIRLIEIQWIKLWSYKPFWVIGILYAVLVVGIYGSAMPVINFFLQEAPSINGITITTVPIYYFPDIWQNITFTAGFLKFLPTFLLILMVCNEFGYKTMRQNIIDGMSRVEVVQSNVILAFLIALVYTLLIGVVTLALGLIYSKSGVGIFNDAEMLLGYFLQLFGFLMFAMLASTLIKRSGITVILIIIYGGFELIMVGILSYYDLEAVANLLPLWAISNVIREPFSRYAFQEIQDYLSVTDVSIVAGQTVLYIYLIYLMLRRRNLV